MINQSLDNYFIKSDYDKISVISFEGLLVNYAIESKSDLLIRGIRSMSDFEYEINLSGINKHLAPQIETVFLPSDPKLSIVSSSMVKEVAKHGGDITQFVPVIIAEALSDKLKSSTVDCKKGSCPEHGYSRRAGLCENYRK